MAVTLSSVLEFNQTEYENMLKSLDIDKKKIEECFEALDEWAKKQEHLVEAYKYLNRNIIERMFVTAKGSLEATKTAIDKFVTVRTMVPDLMLNWSVQELDELPKQMRIALLPKLNPSDQTRIFFVKLTGYVDQSLILTILRHNKMMSHIRLCHDYVVNMRLICDFKDMMVPNLADINPLIFKKDIVTFKEVYNIKIKGLHYVNPPALLDKIISMIKLVVKEKILNRTRLYDSYEDLHNDIPKEILPKDYGGDGPNLDVLSDNWFQYLKTEEAKKIIDEANHIVSDETKRNCAKFNEEYLGIPGSFRQMTVD